MSTVTWAEVYIQNEVTGGRVYWIVEVCVTSATGLWGLGHRAPCPHLILRTRRGLIQHTAGILQLFDEWLKRIFRKLQILECGIRLRNNLGSHKRQDSFMAEQALIRSIYWWFVRMLRVWTKRWRLAKWWCSSNLGRKVGQQCTEHKELQCRQRGQLGLKRVGVDSESSSMALRTGGEKLIKG